MGFCITTLIEDSPVGKKELQNEHGLSFLLETEQNSILFDTGQSGKFIENAKILGKNLRKIDTVIISHGHYDHSGGFREFVDKVSNDFKLFVQENFFQEKYSYDGISYKYRGNNFTQKYLNVNSIKTYFVKETIVEIAVDVYIISKFKKNVSFENANQRYHIKIDDKFVLDNFVDEVMLAVDTSRGWVVLLGCSHPGVVNMLQTLVKRTQKPIYGVIGGTHLIDVDEERILNTIKWFKEMNIKLIGTSHCTGEMVMEKLDYNFGPRFFHNKTGMSIYLK